MGVRYLWVNSLCILQDSEADITRELSYMGQIYADAWFTIAAKDSPSCRSGLFHQRNWVTSAIVPTGIQLPSGTTQHKSRIRGNFRNRLISCMNRLMALPRHHQTSDYKEFPVLETRGWTLQEELLSRRMLNCGKHELSWICLEGTCTERIPAEDDIRSHRKWQYVLKRVLVTGFQGYGNLNAVAKDDVLNHWFEVVENFLRRGLSEREADIDCERYIVKDFLDNAPRSKSGKEAIHFEAHHDFEDAATPSDPWLMLVRTNQSIPGTNDRGYKYDIETQLVRLEKLSSYPLEFRRIGLVTTRSWDIKWPEHAVEMPISLF